MNKIKVGDRLQRVSGGTHRGQVEGDLVTVAVIHGDNVSFMGYNSLYFLPNYKLVQPRYPNAPHKWAKEIKAWADGANIQYESVPSEWYGASKPCWGNDINYRVKPEKSDKDIQIEKLEQQARDLANAIAKLKAQ
ncbi:MAG: hypothetical protein Unbinned1520contig1002_20 [Prokaryotic dsDNA virus sp.]|nr:MAG: hypothetical protein Unbinned1520contig1002_20 [Prokaryotic dsDNA virus sp.]|tara:strand:- start:727 stop:1131 length:405 start_codon:yes stop_codon:yes gene_type:complete